MSAKGFIDHRQEQMEAARKEWKEVWKLIADTLARNGVPLERIVMEETRAWQKWLKEKKLIAS